MQFVVDRIENDVMILEGEEEVFYEVPKKLIPDANEGDCIDISINREATEKRRESVRRLMEELFED